MQVSLVFLVVAVAVQEEDNAYTRERTSAGRDGGGYIIKAEDEHQFGHLRRFVQESKKEAIGENLAKRVLLESVRIVPDRGILKKYPQKKANEKASIGRMLRDAVNWTITQEIAASDPVYVRAQLGMKGAKHWTEWLDLMRLAIVRGDTKAKKLAKAAIQLSVPKALKESAYHEWMHYDKDTYRFRQDSMSYMRAYYLCAYSDINRSLSTDEETRQLVTEWRNHIIAALPKIWSHLKSRGIDQKLNFVKLFRVLGLQAVPEEPKATSVYRISDHQDAESTCSTTDSCQSDEKTQNNNAGDAQYPTVEFVSKLELYTFKMTLLWRQPQLGWYLASPERPYDITHEIFALTDDGRQLFPFKPQGSEHLSTANALIEKPNASGDDTLRFWRYARDIIYTLLDFHIRTDQLDLVCEFVVNFGQLGIRLPREYDSNEDDLFRLYRLAIEFIKARRNLDGSFGEQYDLEQIRTAKNNPTYDTIVGGTLHTTYVCLWALTQPHYEDDAFTSWATNLELRPPEVHSKILLGDAENPMLYQNLEADLLEHYPASARRLE